MNHHISEVQLMVNAPRKTDGFALQTAVSNWFWQELLPELSLALDQIVTDDTVIRLEKLEIEIPMIKMVNWQTQLTPSVCRAIIEEITRRRLYLRTTDAPITERSLSMNGFEAWLSFLISGQRPIATTGNWTDWQMATLESVATSRFALTQLKKTVAKHPLSIERLIRQHKDVFLSQLVAAISSKSASDLATWSDSFMALFEAGWFKTMFNFSTVEAHTIRLYFWQIIFENSFDEKLQIVDNQIFIEKKQFFKLISLVKQENITPQYFAVLMVDFLQKKQPNFFFTEGKKEQVSNRAEAVLIKKTILEITALLQPIKGCQQLVILFKDILETHKTVFEEIIMSQKTVQKQLDTEGGNKEEKEAIKAELKEKESENKIEQTEKDELQTLNNVEEMDGQYVNMAGIVLLHSFLPSFFDALGFLNDSRFRNKKAQKRAVSLLMYLSVGDTEIVEYETSLLKWLCGLPIETPIDIRANLTTAERQEADELLEAVIEHWGALGQVSADSLREGFIQREGKISRRTEGWLLQIERQTLDILFDQLPWGLGVVKLPWQSEMLFVEW
ncbi:MAG: hypothetical protein JNL70_16940 [Saprospiraceae bacterium]|nr:hypothetical protein [Saprospiraceae bacterium]